MSEIVVDLYIKPSNQRTIFKPSNFFMQTKFTPGPWHIDEEPFPEDLQIKAHPNKFIAKVAQWNGTKDANARLIAAAPEMYRLLSDIFNTGDIPEWTEKEMIKLFDQINSL